jgi:acyl-coenzyme A synthetase/AMP-(fatty) acid ligase
MTFTPLSRLMIEGRPDDHPVVLRDGKVINFGQLRADVCDVTARFKDCGCAALICQDSYNFAVGFLGLLHAGADIRLLPHLGSLQAAEDDFDLLIDDRFIENKLGKKGELYPIDMERFCLTFLTSGSTGIPKKILKNLAMLEKEIATLEAVWGQDLSSGCFLNTVSHQHMYGLTFTLLWPLMTGRPFSATTHALWESLFAELQSNAIIVTSPAHLERMGGFEPIPEAQRPKRVFSAGAPLSFAASQQAKTIFGCYPTEIFGSTETGAFATRMQEKGDEDWNLLPGMSICCDENECLVLNSPFVTEEWLTTADVIKPVANGFHFLGRSDSIVKIEGKRISLAEVEQTLGRLSFVKAAAVVVLTDKPPRLVAAVVLSETGQKALQDIGNFRFGRLLREELTPILDATGIPRQWRFVDELPAQALGKRCDTDICALFGEDA